MESDDKIQSLNSLAFIAAFEKYIYDKKDLETVLNFLINKTDGEIIGKVGGFVSDRIRKLDSLELKEKFLKVSVNEKITKMIFRSNFTNYGNLHIKIDKYEIDFDYCSCGMTVVIQYFETEEEEPLYAYTFHGFAEKYEVVDSDEFSDSEEGERRRVENQKPPLDEDLMEYVLFLWKEYEKMQETINYDALEDLSNDDTHSGTETSEENEIVE